MSGCALRRCGGPASGACWPRDTRWVTWPLGKAGTSHSGSGGRREEKKGMLQGLPQGWSCREPGGASLGRSDSPSGSCRTHWRWGWAAGGHKAGFSWCRSRKPGSKMPKHKGGWAAIRRAILWGPYIGGRTRGDSTRAQDSPPRRTWVIEDTGSLPLGGRG